MRARALRFSQMAWSDGRRLAVGDLSGAVHVVALHPDVADPKPDAAFELDKAVAKLLLA
jgi:hypothetical protein